MYLTAMLIHSNRPVSGVGKWIVPFIISRPVWVQSPSGFQGHHGVAEPNFAEFHSTFSAREALTLSESCHFVQDYTNHAHAEPHLANIPAHPHQYNHQPQAHTLTSFSPLQSYHNTDSVSSYGSHNPQKAGYEFAALPSNLDGRSDHVIAQGALMPFSQRRYCGSHNKQAHDLGLYQTNAVNPEHQNKPQSRPITTAPSHQKNNNDAIDGSNSKPFIETRSKDEIIVDLAQSFAETPQNFPGPAAPKPLRHQPHNKPADEIGLVQSNQHTRDNQHDAQFRETTAVFFGQAQNNQALASVVPQPMPLSSHDLPQKLVANQDDLHFSEPQFASTGNYESQCSVSTDHSSTGSRSSTSNMRLVGASSQLWADAIVNKIEIKRITIMHYVLQLRDLLKNSPGSTPSKNKHYPNELLNKRQLRYTPPSKNSSKKKGFIRVMKGDRTVLPLQQLEPKLQGLLGWMWDYQEKIMDKHNGKNVFSVQNDLFEWLWKSLTRPKDSIPVIGHVKPFKPEGKFNIGASQGILIKYLTEEKGFGATEVAKGLVDIWSSKHLKPQVQTKNALEIHQD